MQVLLKFDPPVACCAVGQQPHCDFDRSVEQSYERLLLLRIEAHFDCLRMFISCEFAKPGQRFCRHAQTLESGTRPEWFHVVRCPGIAGVIAAATANKRFQSRHKVDM